jgi:hypothetical protein
LQCVGYSVRITVTSTGGWFTFAVHEAQRGQRAWAQFRGERAACAHPIVSEYSFTGRPPTTFCVTVVLAPLIFCVTHIPNQCNKASNTALWWGFNVPPCAYHPRLNDARSLASTDCKGNEPVNLSLAALRYVSGLTWWCGVRPQRSGPVNLAVFVCGYVGQLLPSAPVRTWHRGAPSPTIEGVSEGMHAPAPPATHTRIY